MDEGSPARIWGMRAVYLALGVVLVLINLIPLDTRPRNWAGPDLLVAMTFAWTLRRPEFVPAYCVAVVVLLADLLFLRPPGLWTALVVMAVQTLRSRARILRDQSFVTEWLAISGLFVAISLGNRLVLAVLMVPQAPLGLSIIHVVMTLICYPLVVMISQFVFGVRKSAPGDLDRLGQRT